MRIHRVHLEEDAAKLVHAGASGRIHGAERSVVDFNRGGTPLVEIVTEPDLRSAAEAAEFGRVLQATLRRMGVSDVNMEEGSLRMDANVSVRPGGGDHARHEDRAEEHELVPLPRARHRGRDRAPGAHPRATAGGSSRRPSTSTRAAGALTSLRSKEEAHDYRYFPEPDLVPIAPTAEMLERARAALPELPQARAERFERDLGLPADSARLLAFRAELGDFLEEALAAGGAEPRQVANWVVNDVAAQIGDRTPADTRVEPAALARLVAMVEGGQVAALGRQGGARRARGEGRRPAALVESLGLGMAGGDELEQIVDRALAEQADAVEKVRAGNDKAIGAVVGAVMQADEGPRRRRRGPAHDP